VLAVIILGSLIVINNGFLEQVSIPLGDVEHSLLSKLLSKHEISFLTFVQKGKGMFNLGSRKELSVRPWIGENDFIFIHLPWALSADTGNKALSI
jgi:hypothetical protein